MVVMEQNLKEAPQVDMDAINRKKQKRLARAIIDEDKGLNSFGIAKKIQKIMNGKQKKTRKNSQRGEEDEELIAREHITKKRHE